MRRTKQSGVNERILLIAEGFATSATLHEATGHAAAIAFNAGNLGPVARALRQEHPRVQLIVCADDDNATPGNPGMTKARAAADELGTRLAVPDFGADRPTGATDFNDLAAHLGIEAVRDQIERASNARRIGRLQVKWLRDIEPKLTALWRVHHLLPQVGLAVIYGESGSGKSYLALDVAAHVALGRDWCDRRCKPGVVVFIAAENPASAENRIATWKQHHVDVSDAPLAVLPALINLRDPSADLPEILALL